MTDRDNDETQATASAEPVSAGERQPEADHEDAAGVAPGAVAGEPADPVAVATVIDVVSEAPVEAGAVEEPAADTSLTLPILPLRGTVVFPLTVVPLAAAQPRSLRLIDQVMSGDRTVALVMQKDAD